MDNISKEYYGNRVLKGVSLKVKKGEIHALLGENGAGKSTLMNVLFGMDVIHTTGGYTGKVSMDGQEVHIDSPIKAMEHGIGMVHQEFMLIPGFTVTENIKIGREISKPSILSRIFGHKLEKLDMKTMGSHARADLDKVGLGIDEYTKVAGMPVGYMQFVEIAREIDKTGVKVLVFDEPTAVLTESEAETLLAAMKTIADSGISIIFITHRLDEVMTVCDGVTILRDGELVKSLKTSETNVVNLAELMVGRELEVIATGISEGIQQSSETALELNGFYVHMEGEAVKGLNLEVKKGEIFGIGGLAGQGKIGICNGIMGIAESEGMVKIFGEEFDPNELGAALKKGISFVSEDRRGVGLLLDKSIAHNIVFSALQVNEDYLWRKGPFTQMDNKAAVEAADKYIKSLDIRCTGYKQSAGSLSGGNQQKVCLARAIALNPRLLLVAEPTRGIDVGAKKLVLDELVKLNEQGLTVIMVSSELAELRSICHRISIITDGKVARILKPDDSDADFGLAMSGTKVTGGEALE